jgi:indoleacetamide hydrolase
MSLHELSVKSALAGLRARQFSPSEYWQELLAWQSRWSALNVYTAQDLSAVHAAAKQADARQATTDDPTSLNGLPIAVKDNIDCLGYATTCGTPGLLQHRPHVTAPLLQRLVDLGAFVTGKTGLHELAAGGTCANLVFGVIRNPYNLEMVPGGSSGGSAAAVAARLVPAALGTDTAGSIRAPASHCGCVGFRPTTGRYNTAGLVPGASRRDTMGWFARSVADIEFLDGLSGTTAAPTKLETLRGVRLGVPRRYFYESLHASVTPIVEESLRRLAEAGAVLVDVDVPDVGVLTEEITTALRPEFPEDLGSYLRAANASITVGDVTAAIADPVLRQIFSGRLSAGQSLEGERQENKRARSAAREDLTRAVLAFRQLYSDAFDTSRCAAFVLPACPDPPYPVPADPSLGGTGPVSMIRNTEPSTLAALPSLAVPGGLTPDGLPVGIQFDGPSGSDLTVLRIGRLFEAITDPLAPPRPRS